jgi:hypothetical protein
MQHDDAAPALQDGPRELIPDAPIPPNGEFRPALVKRGRGRPPGVKNKVKPAEPAEQLASDIRPTGGPEIPPEPAIPAIEAAILKAAAQSNGPGPQVSVADVTADNIFDNLHLIRKAETTGLVADAPVEVTMAVRKPKAKEFFKVCPDREMSFAMTTYVRKVVGSFEEEFWSVLPRVEGFLAEMEEGRSVQLLLCQTDKGINFFWPVPIVEGSDRPFVTSARACARLALTKWVRIKWRKADATYLPHEKKNQEQEAVWPEDSLSTLLKRAFGNRIIDSVEHRVIQEDLYGEDGQLKRKDGTPDSDSWI